MNFRLFSKYYMLLLPLFLILLASPAMAPDHVDYSQDNYCYEEDPEEYFTWRNWQGVAYSSKKYKTSERFFDIVVPHLPGWIPGGESRYIIEYQFVWQNTTDESPITQGCENPESGKHFHIYHNHQCVTYFNPYFEVNDICKNRKNKIARICYPFSDTFDVLARPRYVWIPEAGWDEYLNEEIGPPNPNYPYIDLPPQEGNPPHSLGVEYYAVKDPFGAYNANCPPD